MSLVNVHASPRFSISAAVIGVALAVAAQFVAVVAFQASLATRVDVIERDVVPLRNGDLAVLRTEVRQTRDDVAWIRQKLDDGARR